MRLFVPLEMQNGYERGQRIKMEVAHKGDKKIADTNGATLTYEPEYELLNIEKVVVSD